MALPLLTTRTEDTPTNAELKGLLNAPRVVFDVDKTSNLKVFFQIRFNTVQIRFNDSDNQNMNGWVIAASATLPQNTVKAEDATASTLKPGDYSLSRLLSAFSVPTVVQLQLARYRAPPGPTLDNADQSLYNSIVFCEMFDSHIVPLKQPLKLEDNVASPGPGSAGNVLGASVIDHRTFLEGYLLPRLEEFSAAFRVIPLMPHQSTPSPNEHLLISRCCIGGDPGSQSDANFDQQLKANAGYEFKNVGPRKYQWARTYAAPGNDSQVLTYEGDLTGKIYRKYDVSVKSTATVSWETGSDAVLFSALVEYSQCDGWRKGDANFSCLNGNDCISRRFTVTISWSLNIRLRSSSTAAIPNGCIQPVVDSINPSTGMPDDYQMIENSAAGGSFEPLLATLLKRKLSEFQDKLAETGPFIYPAAGQLVYGRPRLNELGDIVTGLDYLTSLADRHMPRLEWYVMSYNYNPENKQIDVLVFAEPSKHTYLGPKAKIGLPDPYASIANLNAEDGPWNYDEGVFEWIVDQNPDSYTVFTRGKNPQDGFLTSNLGLSFLMEVTGKVVGNEPLVVEVQEVWNCKNNEGNQIGLYATAFFAVKLDSRGTAQDKTDADAISWEDVKSTLGYEPSPPSMSTSSQQNHQWKGSLAPKAVQQPSTDGSHASAPGPRLSSVTASKKPLSGRGGGAIQDLKQKIQVNPNSGTLEFSVPIPSSPGRAGLDPSLMLNYSSGYGNGIFGLGWKLNLRSITRRTSKSIPRYDSEDIFLLDGVDELVPLLVDNKIAKSSENSSYTIDQFVPRIIQENKLYGSTDESLVFEQKKESDRKIFTWLPTTIYDALGNAMEFAYKAEDTAGMDGMPTQLQQSEASRDKSSQGRARYLKSVKYGNRTPNRDPQNWDLIVPIKPRDWMFELVLDYGEHDLQRPTVKEENEWSLRKDPFSSYTSGFEIRHYRLCRRALMFHHIPEALDCEDYLVSSTTFQYCENANLTLMSSLTVAGHMSDGDGGFTKDELAPWEFSYSQSPNLASLPIERVANFNILAFPANGHPLKAEWVDLDGDGAPGILVEDSSKTFYYQRNRSNANSGAGFAQVYQLPGQPIHLSSESYFEDVNRNGKMDLVFVDSDNAALGYYERNDHGWDNFRYFDNSLRTGVPESESVRIDLVGNGLQDIMLLDDETGHLKWHPSLAEKGFGNEMSAPKVDGNFHLGNPNQQVLTLYADMCGDGLVDVVHVGCGKISYWPNMGYGRFGREIVMGNCPSIGEEGYLDASRVRLADVDGTGAQDLLYFPPGGGAQLYYNLSRNSWSDPVSIPQFPSLDSLATVSLVDLFGNGTSCLCWTGPDSWGSSSQEMMYLDLTKGCKPYILNRFSNGLGLVWSISYLSSSHLFRQDEADGRSWNTRLPTPIQCVQSTKEEDLITGTCLTTRFRYHDGIYDGDEQEFAGFAEVEQWDAEVFESNQNEFARPPIQKRLWYHSGCQELAVPPPNLDLDVALGSFEVPSGITRVECFRSLRGKLVREEVYCQDDSMQQNFPYTISQFNYEVDVVQQKGENAYCSVRVNDKETLSVNYERQMVNPRYSHEVVLETNHFGQALQSLTVAYGLKNSTLSRDFEKAAQEEDVITLTENAYTNCCSRSGAYREPALASVRKWRLLQFKVNTSNSSTLLREVQEAISSWNDIDINSMPNVPIRGKVLLENRRTYYIRNDLTDYLDLGEIQDFSATSRTFELASQGPMPWLDDLRKISDHEAWQDISLGSVKLPKEESLWRPESYFLYSDTKESELKEARNSFYTPVCTIDSLGHKTTFAFDDKFLFRTRVTDGVGNTTTTKYNYSHLKPVQVCDPNGNRTHFVYDAFNNLVGVAEMGKVGEEVGDSAVGAQQLVGKDVLNRFMQDPILHAKDILGSLTERRVKDNTRLYRNLSSGRALEPCYEAVVRRQEHLHSGRSADIFSISISYLDSRGEVTEQAELTSTGQKPTWCISGRSLKDNKGEIVREYRPVLSPTHAFRSHDTSYNKAITYLLDPLGRRVATLNPDRTWSKTIVSPWHKVDFDQGDTILADDPALDQDVSHLVHHVSRDLYFPTWHNLRRAQGSADMSEIAVNNAALHNTPTINHFDALGRQISAQSDKGGLNATTITTAMDSGTIHKLFNSLGMEVLRWTDSGIITKRTYDPVGRLSQVKVGRGKGLPAVTEMYIYGEDQPQPELKNLRGKLYEVRDQSGVSRNLEFDFKNNCIAKSLHFAANYKDQLDWAGYVQLDDEPPFLSFMTYNASNQVVSSISPNGDVTRTGYNPWGLQCRSTWQEDSGADIQVLVDNMEYNEDRKPTVIQRGNKCLSTYVYDHCTGRLAEKMTVGAYKKKIQHKIIIRDCFGREAHVTDLAQDVSFFRNVQVKPVSTYRYDGLGRIISATGVEQVNVHSQTGKSSAQAMVPTSYAGLDSPTNGQEVAAYTETYLYDITGNMKEISHQFKADNGIRGWTRKFSYNEPSLLRKGDLNNQLSESTIGDSVETFRYLKQDSGALGCLEAMPGYPSLSWDFANRLKSSSTQYQKDGIPETTFYVYDSQGTRFQGDGQTLSLEKRTSMVDVSKGWVLIESSTLGKTPVANLMRYQIDHGLEVDAESRLVLHEIYSPFGMTTYAACGADIKAPAVYRYSAYERDQETGLYYAKNRYYAPWLGRWLSPDTKGIADGLNRYAYVSNDPISFIDPQGTDKKWNEEGSSGQNGGQPAKTWTDTMKESLPTQTTALRAVEGIVALSAMKFGLKKLNNMVKSEEKKAWEQSVHSFKKTILPQETFARNIYYDMKLAYGKSDNPTGQVNVNPEKLGFFLSNVNKMGGELIDVGADKAFDHMVPKDPVTSSLMALQDLHSQYKEAKAAKKNALGVDGETGKSEQGDEKADSSEERLGASGYLSMGIATGWLVYKATKAGNETKQSVETVHENAGPAFSMLYKAACLPNKVEPSRNSN
ncbi:rhs repeat-associated core domain-containing protein [Fusarium napiforme]|uniref:Rhs repeat-associated core domain-containing protein n=1 Tax=Fusarium napiforme TaxID=42672 RepID=A0A8H5JB54_9HYPO|nr:rhs repeat-associated core domain-containing protein [Fusarium napiforme]